MNQILLRRSNYVIGKVIFPRYSGLAETFWDEFDFRRCPWYDSGSFFNLSWHTDVAPGLGKSVTIRLRVNGVPTALSITLEGSETYKDDTAHSVTISAGDLVDYEMVGVGEPTFSGNSQISLEWLGDTAKRSLYMLHNGTLPSSGSGFTAPFLAENVWQAVADRSLVPIGGNVLKYTISTNVAAGAGRTYTFVWLKNGVVQDGSGGTPNTTIVIGAGQSTGTWTGALRLDPGNYVQIRVTKSGSAEVVHSIGGLQFDADNDGEYVLTGSSVQSVIVGTRYNDPQAGTTDGWTTAEGNVVLTAVHSPFTISAFRYRAEGGPDAGVLTTRKNLTDTALAISIPGTGSGAGPVGSVTFDPGDTLSVKWMTAGPLSGGFIRWAWAMTGGAAPPEPPPTPETPGSTGCVITGFIE